MHSGFTKLVFCFYYAFINQEQLSRKSVIVSNRSINYFQIPFTYLTSLTRSISFAPTFSYTRYVSGWKEIPFLLQDNITIIMKCTLWSFTLMFKICNVSLERLLVIVNSKNIFETYREQVISVTLSKLLVPIYTLVVFDIGRARISK